MSVDAHRQAAQLMSEAEIVELRGDRTSAAELYRQAADLELEALRHVPSSRSKTRGMVAVSAINLYRAAGDLSETIRHAHFCLSLSDLPDFAIKQLNEILYEAARELRARENNQTLDNTSVRISLSGGIASNGVASYDSVLWELEHFQKYLVRVIEWVAGSPFRTFGPPPQVLLNWCTPMISAPSLGSVEFQILFRTPLQPYLAELAVPPPVKPEDVTAQSLNILETLIDRSPVALEHDVPDEKYRLLFLKVIRNLAPNGKDIGEIRVNRVSPSGERSLLLKPDMRRSIRDYFRMLEPSSKGDTEIRGVLRELSLDREWITVVADGQRHRLRVRKSDVEGFDDIIGPFVNKSVQVSAYWQGRRQPYLWVRDIELAE
jgi:hypothetical protein